MRLAAQLVPFCRPSPQDPYAGQKNNAHKQVVSVRGRFCQMMWGLAAKCSNSAALMRYLSSRIQSCYCAPIIWVFAPRYRETRYTKAMRGVRMSNAEARIFVAAVAVLVALALLT
jgi:hypothetical protein